MGLYWNRAEKSGSLLYGYCFGDVYTYVGTWLGFRFKIWVWDSSG